jgi:hypothetical protein
MCEVNHASRQSVWIQYGSTPTGCKITTSPETGMNSMTVPPGTAGAIGMMAGKDRTEVVMERMFRASFNFFLI